MFWLQCIEMYLHRLVIRWIKELRGGSNENLFSIENSLNVFSWKQLF